MDSKNIFLAIDLGTTNTVMAWGQKNINGCFDTRIVRIPQLDSMRNIQAKEILPSVLYVDHSGQRYVGEIGKWMRDYQSSRVIYNSKRKMGTDYKWEVDGEVIRPANVASEILKLCRNAAGRYFMRDDIYGVTITVPASFNSDQVKDTIDAAVEAGFKRECIEIMPEPTAALLDFINCQAMIEESDRLISFSKETRILVFDIGGGTCDVSVIDVNKDNRNVSFREKAVGRYDELGGTDFDVWAAEYLINKFIKENHIEAEDIGKDELNDMKNKLVVFCEKAKEYISSEVERMTLFNPDLRKFDITFNQAIPEFYKGRMYSFSLTKDEYDSATESLYHKPVRRLKDLRDEPLYKNIEEPIINTLKDYGIDTSSIDYVFMTGGMSKYIKVQDRVREILNKPVVLSQYPMESVARGAAVYHYYTVKSSKLDFKGQAEASCIRTEGIEDVVIKEVLAEAIMVDVNDGLPEIIIPCDQPVPFSGTMVGRLKTTSPSGIKIDIYAGRDEMDSRMRIQRSYQGRFASPVKTGTPIDIEYKIDKNKYLTLKVIIKDDIKQKIDLYLESDVTIEKKEERTWK